MWHIKGFIHRYVHSRGQQGIVGADKELQLCTKRKRTQSRVNPITSTILYYVKHVTGAITHTPPRKLEIARKRKSS